MHAEEIKILHASYGEKSVAEDTTSYFPRISIYSILFSLPGTPGSQYLHRSVKKRDTRYTGSRVEAPYFALGQRKIQQRVSVVHLLCSGVPALADLVTETVAVFARASSLGAVVVVQRTPGRNERTNGGSPGHGGWNSADRMAALGRTFALLALHYHYAIATPRDATVTRCM